jgi:hypothetical protein
MPWLQQEDQTESSTVHATFQRRVGLLAEASKDYQVAATDFIRGLLRSDPSKRMTAQDALRHRFLTDAFADIAPDAMPS